MTSAQSSLSPWFRGWRLWALAAAVWTAIGLLQFSYFYLDVFVRGRTESFHIKLIEELTGAWGTGILFPFIVRVTNWAQKARSRWLIHLPALVAFSVGHTTWNWASRVGAHAALGLPAYDYGQMPLRYAMEFGNDAISYVSFVILVLLFGYYRAARDNEVRLATLEAEVTRARLQALESRLHPHFLFNALNTVSSVMYDDVRAADGMLSRLADLLRRTLRTDASEVALREELEILDHWLAVMRARFDDRLSVTLDVPPSLHGAMVPPLVLQPLLENAVKHGDPGPGRSALIRVTARREHDYLLLSVCDNGPGLSGSVAQAMQRGVGLSTTERRLHALYNGRHTFELHRAPDGGLDVRLSLPWREVSTDE